MMIRQRLWYQTSRAESPIYSLTSWETLYNLVNLSVYLLPGLYKKSIYSKQLQFYCENSTQESIWHIISISNDSFLLKFNLFIFFYSWSLLVIYFKYSSVYMSMHFQYPAFVLSSSHSHWFVCFFLINRLLLFFFLKYLFIYLWLCWVFVSV